LFYGHTYFLLEHVQDDAPNIDKCNFFNQHIVSNKSRNMFIARLCSISALKLSKWQTWDFCLSVNLSIKFVQRHKPELWQKRIQYEGEGEAGHAAQGNGINGPRARKSMSPF
jgi:hypothetical protein